MATADEILAAEVCDDILTVDLDSRIINIPKNVTNLGVQSDDNVRKLHFRVPRYYCDVDLSTFVIRINYMNAKKGGDVYDVPTSEVVDDMICFDWEVGRNAVAWNGEVKFIVCLKDVDTEGNVLREFNTTIATLPVLPGLETGEMVIQEYHDLLEEWKAALFGASEDGVTSVQEATDTALANIETAVDTYVAEHQEELTGPQGETGATFTPTVDESGNISWSNDRGLENPTTRNIVGPKGETGDPFTYDMFTTEQLEALRGPQGIQGETGAAFTYDMFTAEQLEALRGPQGIQGETGTVFTPNVDTDGNISWTNDGGLANPATRNITGPQGIQGETGAAFTYDMFTAEQLEALRGPQGETGAAFTYDMFTEEQLEALIGPQGEKGTSIDSIKRTSGTGAAGTTDTYTITTSDGSTHTFNVYNGADGEGAGDMLKSIYDPQNKNTDIFAYVDGLVGEIDTVLDTINGEGG